MIDSILSGGFFGRFEVSYKDGEMIYAYDDITCGVYKFSLRLKEVSLVLSPVSIHRNRSERIRGITKRGDEILIIPTFPDSEWIFYNIKTEEIRYATPIKEGCISEVKLIGNNLFLVPFDTNNPITIFSIENMKIVRFYENWYKKNEGNMKNGKGIWGASSYRECILFPIPESKDIVFLNYEKINVITLDISFSILSASIWEDKIWVLPMAGMYIYAVDLNGNIIDKVDLPNVGTEILASAFCRIIAIKENVFLLPAQGEIIYTYQCKKNEYVQIRGGEKQLYGKLFSQNIFPYWDYIIEDGKLYLLPLRYQCRCIKLDSLESNNCELKYGNNINDNDYWKMIGSFSENYMLKEKEDILEEFIQLVSYSYRISSIEKNTKIGEQIWEVL